MTFPGIRPPPTPADSNSTAPPSPDNHTGPALTADNLVVGGDAHLMGICCGHGDQGAVRLLGARFGGHLDLRGATITNPTGPALAADHLRIADDAHLAATFTGTGESGTVSMLGAHIRGRLQMDGATITNPDGPALVADRITVDNSASLNGTYTGQGQRGTLRLHSAHISGQLHLDDATITNNTGGAALNATSATIDIDTKQWLDILRTQTFKYAAQPYRQYADLTAAQGHDADTRTTLIAQRRDQLNRAGLPKSSRRWGRLTWITLGYGYQPWKALLWLAALTGLSTLLFILSPNDIACPLPDRALLGADTAIPLITNPLTTTCQTAPAGQPLTTIALITQTTGWALATLFAAGFTSIIRKT